MRRFSTITAACLAASVVSATAAAQDVDRFTAGYETGWYLLGGLTGGGAFSNSGDGGFIGGEVSVAALRQGIWYGLYADAAYDSSQQTATITMGPEFGWMALGIDGGVGIRPSDESGLLVGPQGRVLLTFGVFSLYGRLGFWPEAATHKHVRQFGALLKLPLIAPWGFAASAPWDMGGER